MDAFINGEPIDLSPLMIYMCSKRRNPIGAESYGFWCLTIGIEIYFFTSHDMFSTFYEDLCSVILFVPFSEGSQAGSNINLRCETIVAFQSF